MCLRGLCHRSELVERQQPRGRAVEDPSRHYFERAVDVHELTRAEQPPGWVRIHALACDDHQWPGGSLLGSHAAAEVAGVLQRRTRLSLQKVERMGIRVAQRPQFIGGRQHKVDREQRQVRGDPAARGLDPRGDVAVASRDLMCDQRKEALGVGVPFDQAPVIAEVHVECGQVLDHAVVGEQPPLLLEGVRVMQIERAGGGEADMSDESSRVDLARLAPEALIVVGGDRLLTDVGSPLVVKPAQTGPIRFAMALRRKAVGRVEQPEHSPGGLATRAHPEQATHDQPDYAVSRRSRGSTTWFHEKSG